jgi:hypothetical protein
MNPNEPKVTRKQRSTKQKATPQTAVQASPVTEAEPEQQTQPVSSAKSKIAAAARVAGVPVKEAYLVSVGILDWALEQAGQVEKVLVDRGERRNEVIKSAVARVSSSITNKAAPAISKASEGVEKFGETVAAGSRKLRERIATAGADAAPAA